eukprot:9222890-Pyramimonas_sp.AAC.1
MRHHTHTVLAAARPRATVVGAQAHAARVGRARAQPLRGQALLARGGRGKPTLPTSPSQTTRWRQRPLQ